MSNVLPSKDKIYERLTERQEKQKLYHDQRAKELQPLMEGQPVSAQDPRSGHWSPAKVLSKCEEPQSYLIQTKEGTKERCNHQHLKGDKPPNSAKKTQESTPVEKGPQPVTEIPTVKSYTTGSGRICKMPKRYLNDF